MSAGDLRTAPSGPAVSGRAGAEQAVARILASCPAPPMPPRLVARLDEALAAEAARSRAATRPPGPGRRPGRR